MEFTLVEYIRDLNFCIMVLQNLFEPILRRLVHRRQTSVKWARTPLCTTSLRGVVGGKTAVSPWFCKLELGGGSGGAPLCCGVLHRRGAWGTPVAPPCSVVFFLAFLFFLHKRRTFLEYFMVFTYISFIPYFRLLVFGILVTLVSWFSFRFFFRLAHLGFAKCKQRLRNIFVFS